MIIFIKLYLLPKSFLKNNNALFRLSHVTKHECITKQSLLKLLRCDEQVIKLHIKLLDFLKQLLDQGHILCQRGLYKHIQKNTWTKTSVAPCGEWGFETASAQKTVWRLLKPLCHPCNSLLATCILYRKLVSNGYS